MESCLDDYGRDECAGEVEYRTPLSSSGVAFPRCDLHWDGRLDAQDRIDRDYPDCDTPPLWFDPLYAGEKWDDE